MDTPIITQYYKEHDPMKRKELLEQSIALKLRFWIWAITRAMQL